MSKILIEKLKQISEAKYKPDSEAPKELQAYTHGWSDGRRQIAAEIMIDLSGEHPDITRIQPFSEWWDREGLNVPHDEKSIAFAAWNAAVRVIQHHMQEQITLNQEALKTLLE